MDMIDLAVLPIAGMLFYALKGLIVCALGCPQKGYKSRFYLLLRCVSQNELHWSYTIRSQYIRTIDLMTHLVA